jgi:hypothetical protein
MRPWIERARAFVAENRDHAGIQRGIELLDALLARYVDLANGDRYRRFNAARRRQISAIAEAAMQGTTGEDLLCALIASVHAGYDGPGDPTVEYGIREHHRLNDPRRREEVQAIVWTQAVGVRVKELRAADRRALGRELFSVVGPLLVRVADAIRRRQLREAHDRRMFAEPFPVQ